jgi:hypothetical protein
LALLRRLPPERVEEFVMQAPRNLHKSCHLSEDWSYDDAGRCWLKRGPAKKRD